MILITSANGNQGKHLIPKLLAAGHSLRACVRSEESARYLGEQGVHQVLVGDLADTAFIAEAVRGVASLYHIGPTLHAAERDIGFAMVDAARAAGVGHFVFSSVLHAITTDLIQHEIKRDIEEHLLSSGLAFTILQPANYMLPHRLTSVFQEDVFRLSWSLDRLQSMVDLDDVTDVVAEVLAQPETHFAATYELAAPGRFSGHDIGRVLSEVLGRDIRVERIDSEAFIRARMEDADPSAQKYQLRMIRAIEARYSSHDFLGNPNVLTWLLGRSPTTFEAFVRKQSTQT
ncbi:NmrA family NAD(P)-binding protein [Aestuariicella hydrocarbonica]|uniref:NmrA family NAD(P)-binding protein n=1 Tax=Pseudomaricurvus hydrocarbonicus TaxID=1470433 RepID=A0A9E5T4W4_9GAMM|nr:NmrA family NAD(P)-binding protein [Aestuariicella hydrocarbonica]NHO68329.1 NmrA family NAD(P)-binding protein [Aestuariicella hydrocarbonica]